MGKKKASDPKQLTGEELSKFKFLQSEEPPSRSEMQAAERLLNDNIDNGVLFNIDPRLRQALVNRVYARGLRSENDRIVMRAAQTAAAFDRVNLAYRMAGFGDFAGGKDDPIDEQPVDLDRDFCNYARAQALRFARGDKATDSLNIQRATPLSLATFASKGAWTPARHLLYLDDRVCEMIHKAENGLPGPRILLVDSPPRHGKSEYCSKWVPSWFVGQFPNRRVMLASYSDAFSRLWGRAAKENVQEHGLKFFGVGISQMTRAGNEWEIAGKRGGMITSGVGGSFTGRGANLMLIDDPIKNAEEAISDTIRQAHWDWWQSTAWTRLEPNGIAIIIMTRWHDDDLAGRIEKWGNEQGVGVERVSFPAYAGPKDVLGRKEGEALWPERMPKKELKLREDMLDAYWWGAMYQGKPGTYGDSEWPEEYFEELFIGDGESWPTKFVGSVVTLDPSKGQGTKKGDFSAIVYIGLARGKLWVDADIKRRPVPKMCSDLVDFSSRYEPDKVGVEVNAFQELLLAPIDEACRDAGIAPLPIATITNTTNKGLRISRLGPWLSRKKFRFRRNKSTELLVQQLKDFPFGVHDDGPDSLEMSLRLLRWAMKVPEEVERV